MNSTYSKNNFILINRCNVFDVFFLNLMYSSLALARKTQSAAFCAKNKNVSRYLSGSVGVFLVMKAGNGRALNYK